MSALSREFIHHWHERLSHASSIRSAWHDLIRDWKMGVSIPGAPPYFDGHPRPVKLPRGWSYKNLVKAALTRPPIFYRIDRPFIRRDSNQ